MVINIFQGLLTDYSIQLELLYSKNLVRSDIAEYRYKAFRERLLLLITEMDMGERVDYHELNAVRKDWK
jgi:hypothetical protein